MVIFIGMCQGFISGMRKNPKEIGLRESIHFSRSRGGGVHLRVFFSRIFAKEPQTVFIHLIQDMVYQGGEFISRKKIF